MNFYPRRVQGWDNSVQPAIQPTPDAQTELQALVQEVQARPDRDDRARALFAELTTEPSQEEPDSYDRDYHRAIVASLVFAATLALLAVVCDHYGLFVLHH